MLKETTFDYELMETVHTLGPLMDDKDLRAIKSNLQIVRANEKTFVVVLAVHKNMERNDVVKIQCEAGTPIGGYVYNNVEHCYHVRCLAFQSLGYISFSCWLRIKNNLFWKTHVPLPEPLILRHLDAIASAKLKNFQARHKSDCYFQFMQMVD